MLRLFYVLALGYALSSLPYHPETTQPNLHPANYSFNNKLFAFGLLHSAIRLDTADRNLLISPLSLYLSLGILYNGAGHATRDSIAQALQSRVDLDNTQLNIRCKELLQQMPMNDSNVRIALANSIWCNRRKLVLLPAFEEISESYYYAPAQSLNFGSPEAPKIINRWVSQNTHKKIPTIIDRTNPNDRIYLLDAALFNSIWQSPFAARDNRMGLFYLENGRTEETIFMSQTLTTHLYSDTAFTMLELPYGNGKAYSMYVILPDDPQQPLHNWAAGFTEEKLDQALTQMSVQSVQVQIPSWEGTYSRDMRALLTGMGLGIAFNDYDNADFSGMCQQGRGKACISKVIQKAYIRVNENGAEINDQSPAPSNMENTVTRPHHTVTITADHSFLYFILDKQRNIVLFTGVMADPRQS